MTFTRRSSLLALAGAIALAAPLATPASAQTKLKLVLNGSYLRYADAAVLRQLLNDPDIENGIGIDLGFGFKYRPLLNENLFFVGGASTLKPNGGFKRALADDQSLFSTFLALTIAY